MTKYKVLGGITSDSGKAGGSGWYELSGEYEGSSPRAAINAALKSGNAAGDVSGSYVAVPARSWHPVKVAPETVLKFS